MLVHTHTHIIEMLIDSNSFVLCVCIGGGPSYIARSSAGYGEEILVHPPPAPAPGAGAGAGAGAGEYVWC